MKQIMLTTLSTSFTNFRMSLWPSRGRRGLLLLLALIYGSKLRRGKRRGLRRGERIGCEAFPFLMIQSSSDEAMFLL